MEKLAPQTRKSIIKKNVACAGRSLLNLPNEVMHECLLHSWESDEYLTNFSRICHRSRQLACETAFTVIKSAVFSCGNNKTSTKKPPANLDWLVLRECTRFLSELIPVAVTNSNGASVILSTSHAEMSRSRPFRKLHISDSTKTRKVATTTGMNDLHEAVTKIEHSLYLLTALARKFRQTGVRFARKNTFQSRSSRYAMPLGRQQKASDAT